MSDFELDLAALEDDLEDVPDRRIVLGVLDDETSGDVWLQEIQRGNVLVLNVVGELTELASEFAHPVKDAGGSLMHFRDFLIVTPPDVGVDTSKLD